MKLTVYSVCTVIFTIGCVVSPFTSTSPVASYGLGVMAVLFALPDALYTIFLCIGILAGVADELFTL